MSKKIPFKRRRQKLTNYQKRLKLIKSNKPRLVIRISNKYITCQLVNYKANGDEVVTSFTSKKLSDYGFKGSKNLQSAYLAGLVTGLKALKKDVKNAVLDTGLKTSVKNSRIYACLKGALDAGVKIPHGPEVLPNDKLLKKQDLDKYIKSITSGVK